MRIVQAGLCCIGVLVLTSCLNDNGALEGGQTRADGSTEQAEFEASGNSADPEDHADSSGGSERVLAGDDASTAALAMASGSAKDSSAGSGRKATPLKPVGGGMTINSTKTKLPADASGQDTGPGPAGARPGSDLLAGRPAPPDELLTRFDRTQFTRLLNDWNEAKEKRNEFKEEEAVVALNRFCKEVSDRVTGRLVTHPARIYSITRAGGVDLYRTDFSDAWSETGHVYREIDDDKLLGSLCDRDPKSTSVPRVYGSTGAWSFRVPEDFSEDAAKTLDTGYTLNVNLAVSHVTWGVCHDGGLAVESGRPIIAIHSRRVTKQSLSPGFLQSRTIDTMDLKGEWYGISFGQDEITKYRSQEDKPIDPYELTCEPADILICKDESYTSFIPMNASIAILDSDKSFHQAMSELARNGSAQAALAQLYDSRLRVRLEKTVLIRTKDGRAGMLQLADAGTKCKMLTFINPETQSDYIFEELKGPLLVDEVREHDKRIRDRILAPLPKIDEEPRGRIVTASWCYLRDQTADDAELIRIMKSDLQAYRVLAKERADSLDEKWDQLLAAKRGVGCCDILVERKLLASVKALPPEMSHETLKANGLVKLDLADHDWWLAPSIFTLDYDLPDLHTYESSCYIATVRNREILESFGDKGAVTPRRFGEGLPSEPLRQTGEGEVTPEHYNFVANDVLDAYSMRLMKDLDDKTMTVEDLGGLQPEGRFWKALAEHGVEVTYDEQRKVTDQSLFELTQQ